MSELLLRFFTSTEVQGLYVLYNMNYPTVKLNHNYFNISRHNSAPKFL